MTLLNVAYVSNFMANLVSQDILYAKGLYFDNWKMHLHQEVKTVGFVERYNGHYLLGNNVKIWKNDDQTGFAVAKTGSMQDWHQILGHAFYDAIQNLKDAAKGVKVLDKGKDQIPKTNKCKTCALSKMHQIISRKSDKSEDSNKPFHWVIYNLMQFTTAINKDQWVSHFACSSTDFNLVFTYPRKSDATMIIHKAINIIATRYNGKTVFFWSDGEKALGLEFGNFIAGKSIIYEPSFPDTPAQNGHFERKGRVLATKARALRIGAGLPTYLWNEHMRTAGYIANRTPMQKHNWKTLFEQAVKTPPNLSHFWKIGCKAYSLNKHIPHTQKFQEQVHIGYLIGYDSTNIFWIWIPSQQKVIHTQDVIFDKTSIYKPHEPNLSQLIIEPMLDVLYDIPTLDTTNQLTEIESDYKG